MEQHMQYLMSLKSKQILKSHLQSSINSFNNSWEEQAFAEDAAGPLGGFVWPPRSYSCTFCRREFRSAQALGGHMNVHRRDRARLKQSLSPQTDLRFEKPSDQSPSKETATQHSSQGGDLGSRSGAGLTSSPFLSASWASAILSEESSSVKSHVSPFSSFITKEQRSRLGYSSSPQGSDSSSLRLVSISTTRTKGGQFGQKEELVTVLNRENAVETNLSMGINIHNLQMGSYNDETINSKRRKGSAMSPSPFFHKPCSSDRYIFQSEGLRIKTSTIEEIDLELRLGDPPAVK